MDITKATGLFIRDFPYQLKDAMQSLGFIISELEEYLKLHIFI